MSFTRIDSYTCSDLLLLIATPLVSTNSPILHMRKVTPRELGHLPKVTQPVERDSAVIRPWAGGLALEPPTLIVRHLVSWVTRPGLVLCSCLSSLIFILNGYLCIWTLVRCYCVSRLMIRCWGKAYSHNQVGETSELIHIFRSLQDACKYQWQSQESFFLTPKRLAVEALARWLLVETLDRGMDESPWAERSRSPQALGRWLCCSTDCRLACGEASWANDWIRAARPERQAEDR